MPSPYDPILTHVGLLTPTPKGTKLTKEAANRYVSEVIALLASGNADGKGGSPTTKIFNAIVPLPPISGPDFPNPVTLGIEKLFWFDPDPFATGISTLLLSRDLTPVWHYIFIDFLYEKLAIALDLNGSTPFFPLFDISVAFPNIDLPFPWTLPDLALKLNISLPDLQLKLLDLGISLNIPSISIPSLPTIDLNLNFGFDLMLPKLLLGLFELPFKLLLNLITPPNLDLVLNLPGLPGIVINLAINLLLELLISLDLLIILPKILIASLLIWLKNIVAMVCVDIVGLLIGTGNIAKGVATLTGLI